MAVEDEEAVTCVRALVRRPHGARHHGQVVGRVDGEEEVHGLLRRRGAGGGGQQGPCYASIHHRFRRMAAKGASGGCPANFWSASAPRTAFFLLVARQQLAAGNTLAIFVRGVARTWRACTAQRLPAA